MEASMVEPGGHDGRKGQYSAITGIDPRAEWLLGPGFPYFQSAGPETLIPFTITAEPGVLARLLAPPPGQKGPEVLRVGRRNLDGGHAALLVRPSFFDRAARLEPGNRLDFFRVAPKRIQLSLPLPPRCLPRWEPGGPSDEIKPPDIGPPPGGWPPGTVVVGIIDDGIAFAHENFLATDGTTRIECFWQQDGDFPATPTVDFGREILKADIDALRAANTSAGIVDEDEVYRQAGLIDFGIPDHKTTAWRLGHGTHVLDRAAGGPVGPVLDQRRIICVQLPIAATAEQSGAGLEFFVERGIQYIRDRAQLLAGSGPELPIVINFSYGTTASSHDGTSALEEAIDEFVQTATPGVIRRVILPSGNSHLGRGHATLRLQGVGSRATLPLRVQPDDQTPNLVQLWMPFAGAAPPVASRLTLTVTSPDGTASLPLKEVPGAVVPLMSGAEEVGQASYSFEGPATQRGLFTIFLHPTTPPLDLPDGPIAPHGLWTLSLENTGLGPHDRLHAWIERDDQMYGYPRRGRQSYFDDPGYLRFDAQGRAVTDDAAQSPLCPVTRAGMINAMATGQESVVVGGFQRRELDCAPYSAGGPISPAKGGVLGPTLRKPDAGLVSDDSLVHAGVLAAGTRSGSTVAMGGTSVAAPRLTRLMADLIAIGGIGDRAMVAGMAVAYEAVLPPGAPALIPNRGGWGRIRVPEALPQWRRR
jgi:hypothetical protein